MPTVRSAVRNFHEYGHRTSMHGLSHMYQAGDLCRKLFWLLLMIAGICACLFHVIMTVRNYLDTPVTSVLIEDAAMAEFPDVTLCNLKPMSESLGDYYKDVVHYHFDRYWGFFDKWWPEERKRGRNESRVAYQRRLRDIFYRYLEIFWVSDDSRDLGMSDKVMLLHCSFNGIPCGDKNFSLLQHSRYWNCYTFSPHDAFRFASSSHMEDTGLNLILYTDSNFHESIYSQSEQYRRRKHDEDEMIHPYSLREFLTTGGRTFNRILSRGRYDIEGLRVWLHMQVDHPMMSSIYSDVQNGYSALIGVDQVQYETLNQPERECTSEPHETIEYTTSFGYNSRGVRKRNYTKTDREYAVEAKQQHVYDRCKCYSHHFPFHVNTKQLCYYVSDEFRMDPGGDLLDRVTCHDSALLDAGMDTYQFIQESRKYKACKYRKFTTFLTKSTWPRSDEHIDFVNEFVLPKFSRGTELVASSDEHKHHIFNFKNANLTSVLNKSVLSHEDLALSRLLSQDCFTNETSDVPLENSWCLDKEKMAYNVLQVIIRLSSPAAVKYEEKFSYEWPEALSEIGGIFGLWVGMSLLTFFEFVELVYLMATSRDSSPRRSAGCGDRGDAAQPNNLEHLLTRLMDDDSSRRPADNVPLPPCYPSPPLPLMELPE